MNELRRGARCALLTLLALGAAHAAVLPSCTGNACTVPASALEQRETSWTAEVPEHTLTVEGAHCVARGPASVARALASPPAHGPGDEIQAFLVFFFFFVCFSFSFRCLSFF